MPDPIRLYGLLAIKVVVALAFLSAGIAKLMGAELMVQTFAAIGWGQWFRYLTAVIEVIGAVLLFIPGWQARGALILICTMIGAVVAHLFVLGPSAIPALVLGVLASVVFYAHKDQILKTPL